MAPHRIRRSTLSFSERMNIYNFLIPLIKKLDDGFCEYIGTDNDASVAAHLKRSLVNVSGIRMEMFGRLRLVRSPISAQVEERLTAIEEYLTRKDPDWRLNE